MSPLQRAFSHCKEEWFYQIQRDYWQLVTLSREAAKGLGVARRRFFAARRAAQNDTRREWVGYSGNFIIAGLTWNAETRL
jgi:hypothetical protein